MSTLVAITAVHPVFAARASSASRPTRDVRTTNALLTRALAPLIRLRTVSPLADAAGSG